jgi:hypothetical protein
LKFRNEEFIETRQEAESKSASFQMETKVGSCLASPDHAMIPCVDEKKQDQALDQLEQ